jgi:GNAT superfamily N-acetyltransferase
MLRSAVPADLARLLEIRDGSGADALSDPALVGDADLADFIAAGAVLAWLGDGRVVGFAATSGGTIHLLVDSTHRGRGGGRELLAEACAELRKAGYGTASLTLAPDSNAERHYRAAGWMPAGKSPRGGLILQKPL